MAINLLESNWDTRRDPVRTSGLSERIDWKHLVVILMLSLPVSDASAAGLGDTTKDKPPPPEATTERLQPKATNMPGCGDDNCNRFWTHGGNVGSTLPLGDPPRKPTKN
jgi:hypothetical protein